MNMGSPEETPLRCHSRRIAIRLFELESRLVSSSCYHGATPFVVVAVWNQHGRTLA
jgi:hypothetical protein